MRENEFDLRHVSFEGKDVIRQLSRRTSPARRSSSSEPTSVSISANENATSGDYDFVSWILARRGIAADIYRMEAVTRRVPACLRALRVPSVQKARELVEARPDLAQRAIDAILVGVTDFQRDARVFEELRQRVVPELARRPGPLRIWSAACSSGQELYSVAMLLAEAGVLESTFLLGTDCRPAAIARARSGIYESSALDSLPSETRSGYFSPTSAGWQIVPTVREQVKWKVADVWATTEDGPWDVILWRNSAIYMNAHAAVEILARLVAALAPDGFLVVGKAERPAPELNVAIVSPCIYRKRRITHVEP